MSLLFVSPSSVYVALGHGPPLTGPAPPVSRGRVGVRYVVGA